MSNGYKHARDHHEAETPSRSAGVPGKRTRTASLPVQFKAAQPRAVQRKAANTAAGATEVDPIAHGFSGPASAVPHADQMSRSFGTDFGAVQAYRGPAAREACEALGAEAFTVGTQIAFRTDNPSPQLVGHELAHTVQQGVVAQGEVRKEVRKKDAAAAAVPGDGLEAEADRAGEAAARGDRVTIAGSIHHGAVQRFQISSAQQTAHPRATTFVRNEMPKVAHDSRLTAHLNTFGTNTGATARNIATEVAWGAGPTVNFTALSGANGEFTPDSHSTELRINETIATAYQAEPDATRLPAHELLLESTIVHEFTHFLDDQDGADRAGEEGQDFEEANYGVDIDSVADAADVMNPTYGAGEWTVRVEAKEAGFPQRVIIAGAASGNGTYDGTVGTSVTVRGPATGRWSLRIEANNGSGFTPSRMHNVRQSATNFLVRSEDWTDRDMNDLEVRVTRTAAAAPAPGPTP
jgi:hypothetical protein